MPGKNVCSRIADPAARRRCENYQGEFAQVGPAAGPAAAPRAGKGRLGAPAGGRMGSLRGKMPRRRGGGGFGGGRY
tara:strand:- start:269 stop:496 length:228 start_codon:yes stop_codon:yes gene_type:complete